MTDSPRSIREQEARSSTNRVSLLARKLTSVNAEIETKMEFSPDIHQHSAGTVAIKEEVLILESIKK